MNGQNAQESRREAHDAVDKGNINEQILDAFVKLSNRPMSSMHMADFLDLPYTTVRPRFSELSNAEWCKKHMNWNQALIKEEGRVEHQEARCKVTAYVLNLVGFKPE